MKLWLIYVGLLILAFIVVEKLFFALIIAGVQYAVPYFVSKLKLNRIGLLNIDTEISNLMIILATRFLSPLYAVIILGATMAIHAYHEEVTDMHSFLENVIRGLILIAIISLFSSTSLLIIIPWAILFSKLPVFMLNKFYWGSNVWSIYNIGEIFAVLGYFAVFKFF